MALNSSAIRAYFNEADYGNNQWTHWAGGLWIIMVMVVVAQVVAAVSMIIGFAMVSQTAALAGLTPPSNEAQYMLQAVGVFSVATLVAVILYLVRKDFGQEREKNLAVVMGACVTLSTAAFIYMASAGGGEGSSEYVNALMSASPLFYAGVLIVFPVIAAGVFIAQKVLHKRSLRSLHTAAPKYRWRRMFFAMAVFWIIAGGLSFIGHVTGQSPAEFVFDPARFWGFALVSLLFIPLQSATEEIILRGYLNQGLSRLIRNPWIVFFITSAGFAALHLGNPEIAQSGVEGNKLITLSGYFFFGMFACVLTYIDGGLETAIGVHAANNLFAAVVVGYEHSALPTPTLYKIGFNSDGDVLIMIVGLSLVCLIMYATRRNTPTEAMRS